MPSLDGWNLDRYRAYLKVRARRLHLNPKLAARFDESDLVQEVLLRAQASGVPCRDESPRVRMAYLDAIFASVFNDHLREVRAQKRDIDKEQVIRQALDESTAAYQLDPADGGASPSQQVARREEFLRAVEAVDQLPERERDVMILVHFEHCSLQEAGERLDITKGQAAGLYGRGMTRLRGRLNPDVGEQP